MTDTTAADVSAETPAAPPTEPAEMAQEAPKPGSRPNTRPAAEWTTVDKLTGQERAYLKDSELRETRVDRAMIRVRIQRAQQAAIHSLNGATVPDRYVTPDGNLTTATRAEVTGSRT